MLLAPSRSERLLSAQLHARAPVVPVRALIALNARSSRAPPGACLMLKLNSMARAGALSMIGVKPSPCGTLCYIPRIAWYSLLQDSEVAIH
jgi:hypothetical protein